jgi:hypothetical protein
MKTKTFFFALGSATLLSLNAVAQQPLSLQTNFVNPTCDGLANGQIRIDISGGVAPYRVNGTSISGSNYTLSSMAQGAYTYTVADANSTVAVSVVTLVAPQPLMVTALVYDVTTYNGADGRIDVTVYNSPQVSYHWSTTNGTLVNPTREDQSSLRAGTYNLRIREENGCITNRQFVVNQPVGNHPISFGSFTGETHGFTGNSAISVYPNPSNGHINLKNTKDTREAMIVNDFGNVLHTFRGANIGTVEGADLNPGVYTLIVIDTDGNKTIERIIIR